MAARSSLYLQRLALLMILALGGLLAFLISGGTPATAQQVAPENTVTPAASNTGTPNTATSTRTASNTRTATRTRTPTNTRTATPTPGCNDWRQVTSPTSGDLINPLYGVAAVGPDDVWAVGFHGGYGSSDPEVLIEHWDGTAWSLVPVTDTGILRGIDVVAPDDIWAVGNTDDFVVGTLTMHWDGTAWSRVPSPSPNGEGTGNYLHAVAAAGPDDVWAVGEAAEQALVLRWNGTQWSIVP